ncbi:MAG: segregation/condensation protein A [Bacillota bacterium]|nr:segregation/condensation protein A [Bacillota bacterium]
MAYAVKLDIFEGPFDLLCHLLDENQVDIYDIPIGEIANQYIEYLDAMSGLDLEVASEFLVLAATLIAIKTKMLLPVKRQDDAGEFPEGYYGQDEDPRNDLVRQILEYKKYKELGEAFSAIVAEQEKKIPRPNDEAMYISRMPQDAVFKNVSLDKLNTAMEGVLLRMKHRELIHRVTKENITIDNQMCLIEALLASSPQGYPFHQLYVGETSKLRVIIIFLALLEMIRRRKIRVLQKVNYGEILLFPYDKVKEKAKEVQ